MPFDIAFLLFLSSFQSWLTGYQTGNETQAYTLTLDTSGSVLIVPGDAAYTYGNATNLLVAIPTIGTYDDCLIQLKANYETASKLFTEGDGTQSASVKTPISGFAPIPPNIS